MISNFKLNKPVFICGMMGSGKTAAGTILARKLDCPFRDIDAIIEKNELCSISQIFQKYGEEYFRKIERETIYENPDLKQPAIVSLGGGSLQNQKITDYLKNNGWLIFLDAPQSVLFGRLKSAENRPMLRKSDTDLEKRVITLLKKRRQYYEQAHLIIKTGRNSPCEIADEIIKNLMVYE
ncbi:MAG: shikimate kinase [Balneolaceae bacterium]